MSNYPTTWPEPLVLTSDMPSYKCHVVEVVGVDDNGQISYPATNPGLTPLFYIEVNNSRSAWYIAVTDGTNMWAVTKRDGQLTWSGEIAEGQLLGDKAPILPVAKDSVLEAIRNFKEYDA